MAHDIAVRLINYLLSHWNPDVHLYSINIPLLPSLRNASAKYTSIQYSTFQRLFLPSDPAKPATPTSKNPTIDQGAPLSFEWAPDIKSLIECAPETLVKDTDAHCLAQGNISVVPLRANYETCYTNNTTNSTLPPQGSTIPF